MQDDSDDLGAFFRDWKEHGRQKRASNRQSSADLLRERGVAFEAKNGGAHLIVTVGRTVVDFWPGTGRWIARKEGTRGFGVRNLLKSLGLG